MINFIKQAVESVEGIKSFLFNTDYRNNFDLQNVEFPCCVLTPIMRTNYDLNNIIRESAELQLSVVDLAPYEYTGDDLYAINKRCSDLALQVIANLQVKSKLEKELTFEFILPSGDELISGVMCNLQCTMKQGSCIGKPSYVEVIVQPIKREIITSNGKHVISPSSGFTAMKEVEVDVNIDIPTIEEKSVDITRNGEVEILPTSADAMTKVTANVQVPPPPLEEKQVTITKAKTTEIITPDAEYGLSRVEVSTDIPLESKQITITENGTTTIEASEGFEGIESVEITTDVNTLQGLDFSEIYDAEQANGINQYYKDGIEYAKQIKDTLLKPASFLKDEKLTILPYISSLKSVNDADRLFARCSNLALIPNVLNFESAQRLYYTFAYNYSISNKHITINAPKCTFIEGVFSFCIKMNKVTINAPELEKIRMWSNETLFSFLDLGNVEKCEFVNCTFYAGEIRITNWKYGDITLYGSSQIFASPLSVHYIIQNAADLADGATVRTLILTMVVKTNWQNSEYYEQDLAVLSTKGITIA